MGRRRSMERIQGSSRKVKKIRNLSCSNNEQSDIF